MVLKEVIPLYSESLIKPNKHTLWVECRVTECYTAGGITYNYQQMLKGYTENLLVPRIQNNVKLCLQLKLSLEN
jgi:hypothetical protein